MPNELTNPNTVVTEERLAQFYQQILPYLGGMPNVMMNRFPKGNIYDVDHEVIVGRWIDGKPIYQKTVAYNDKKLYSDYTTLSLNTDPIETAINGIIVFRVDNRGHYDGAMVQVNVYPSSGGTTVDVYETTVWNGSPDRTFYLTVWYTKIGDSAIEIGSDTDYSTTEKIVGTWIDGKPIWQKTWADITVPASSNSKILTLDGFTVDYLVDVKYAVHTYHGAHQSAVHPASSTVFYTTDGINIYCDCSTKYAIIGNLTLQYTKTSS